MNLIQYAVLLRGGVAVGRVSHESHILFGMGINRAYQFEKSGGQSAADRARCRGRIGY
jgi:hypothetical protein